MVASARKIKPSTEQDLLTVEGDISQPTTADNIVRETLERFGRVDTLINDAGIFMSKPFTDYTAEDYSGIVALMSPGLSFT